MAGRKAVRCDAGLYGEFCGRHRDDGDFDGSYLERQTKPRSVDQECCGKFIAERSDREMTALLQAIGEDRYGKEVYGKS
jgi:hypothetical protein